MWGMNDRSGLGQGQVVGTCECGNKPLCFIKWENSWLAGNRLTSEEGQLLGVSK